MVLLKDDLDCDGHTNVAPNDHRGQGAEYYSHPETMTIAFKRRFCSRNWFAPRIEAFAELMIHEAMHGCEKTTGRPCLDRYASPGGGPHRRGSGFMRKPLFWGSR